MLNWMQHGYGPTAASRGTFLALVSVLQQIRESGRVPCGTRSESTRLCPREGLEECMLPSFLMMILHGPHDYYARIFTQITHSFEQSS